MPKKIDDKNEKVEAEVVAPKAKPEPTITPAQIQQRVKSKAEQMQEQLEKQPKVMILIPLERGEKKGAEQSFCINGYKMSVPKGVMTPVPEQIAQMVSDRYAVELAVRGRSIDQKGTDVKNALE
jgi:hypothetical protein